MRVLDPAPTVIEPPTASRQPVISVRRLVGRFALAGLPALAAVIVITAAASVRVGTRLGIADAKRVNWLGSAVVEQQGLDDSLLDGSTAALAKVDAVVRRYVVRGSLVRVKIWSGAGKIIYSNEPRLIGMQFKLGADELAVLGGGLDVDAHVSDLKEAENLYETERRLLEVYRAVKLPSGTPVLFEGYFRYDDVRRTGRDLWAQFAPIAVGALLVLELVQIPFAVSLARRLRSGQHQRERLLQHAIDASDAERRRIAHDLHDGAVQELTGVSLSLAAAARSSPGVASTKLMVEAGAKIRETVKSLRSMLVDIYPPNLYEEGLESALADLLGGLHNRGVVTHLTVSPGALDLSRDEVSLLYRSAQEAIRNVVSHARASEVSVSVDRRTASTVLVVEDDGIGFDPEMLADRSRAGHVGLRGLVGLVQDAGGEIEVRSEPNRGTFVQISLPR